MRLLERNKAGEICLTEVPPGHDPPPYAVLSHTWGPEEVSFQDLKDGTGKNKLGYAKIPFCGDQAWRDGLQYFWVDTCCIDKSNSTELQEAINSMFRWYRDAVKCYVHLADVSRPTFSADDRSSQPRWKPAFRKSRWFTRGWTLQELIAPDSVEFFSREGVQLGDKRSLEESIHEITEIPLKVLRGSPLSDFSVAERLAWIEKRQTTRKEDKAYSLLGIFGIHMPLIYGEGEENAFRRLREEINRASKSGLLPIAIANDAAFDSLAEEHNARCHPDTRIDLLRQIEAWADDPRGECIFWLNGVAGTGKSTISRTVADRFKKQGILGASFFFKRGERDRGNTARFFTTIAAQLVSQKPQIAQFIRGAIESDPTIATKAIREQFEKLILQPLGRVDPGSRNPTVAVVVDALDECDHDNNIKLIIHLFSQARAVSSVRFRVFITSRPELPIRLGFKDIQGKYQDVALHRIPEPAIEHDISTFLSNELARIRHDYNSQVFDDYQLPPDWPGKHITQTLVHMAIPLFIFAATVCRFIGDEKLLDPAGQLAKILNYQSDDSALDKLDTTYLPVLDQIVVGTTGPTKNHLLNEFRDIVGPIVLLAEPLSASSLAQLLNSSITSISRTLNRLHTVLDIPSRADSPIRLFHLSFRDFLVEPAKRYTNKFWIDKRKTHHNLATVCIQHLGSYLKKDICNLKQPGKGRTEIDPKDINTCLPAHIQYACRYWVSHMEQSKEHIRDGDQVYKFLKCHFLHWLEALTLIGIIAESIAMVNTLQTLVEHEEAKVSAFLYDANRFILNCISSIDAAPLQLYCSAIIFAPERSIIRRMFGIPNWIAANPDMELGWSLCLATLEGHSSWVRSIAFSADGRRLASASDDKTVKLWDAATGQCLATLMGHSGRVRSIAFSADGRRLTSASHDETVKLWDTATGQCLQTLVGHSGWVNSVAFSGDGRRLASASDDKTVKLWDTATGQCLQMLAGHSSSVNSVTFSGDSQRLASASYDKTVKLWDAATGQCLATLAGHSGWVNSVAFSGDGRRLASASDDETIKLWDTATGQCLQTLAGHSSAVRSVAFSGDGRRLASASYDKTVKLWDATTGQCLQTLNVNKISHTLSFDSTGSYLNTDVGTLRLSPSLAPKTLSIPTHPHPSQQPQQPCPRGYGISSDAAWITWNSEKSLWVPQEYRALENSAVAGSAVALGCSSGRVLIFRFSGEPSVS